MFIFVDIESAENSSNAQLFEIAYMIKELQYMEKVIDNKMLLVLSAPSITDSYYKSFFQLIVDCQINYAKAVNR